MKDREWENVPRAAACAMVTKRAIAKSFNLSMVIVDGVSTEWLVSSKETQPRFYVFSLFASAGNGPGIGHCG